LIRENSEKIGVNPKIGLIGFEEAPITVTARTKTGVKLLDQEFLAKFGPEL